MESPMHGALHRSPAMHGRAWHGRTDAIQPFPLYHNATTRGILDIGLLGSMVIDALALEWLFMTSKLHVQVLFS
jgi:hypothetical protein